MRRRCWTRSTECTRSSAPSSPAPSTAARCQMRPAWRRRPRRRGTPRPASGPWPSLTSEVWRPGVSFVQSFRPNVKLGRLSFCRHIHRLGQYPARVSMEGCLYCTTLPAEEPDNSQATCCRVRIGVCGPPSKIQKDLLSTSPSYRALDKLSLNLKLLSLREGDGAKHIYFDSWEITHPVPRSSHGKGAGGGHVAPEPCGSCSKCFLAFIRLLCTATSMLRRQGGGGGRVAGEPCGGGDGVMLMLLNLVRP